MPSGGWLQSSPVIPELGFMLNSRAQMFWLEPDLPNSLMPGKRPRTTLSPSLALRDGQPWLAKVDTKAQPIDPGSHTLRATMSNGTVEKTLVACDEMAAGRTPKPGPQVDRQLSAPIGGRTTLKETT